MVTSGASEEPRHESREAMIGEKAKEMLRLPEFGPENYSDDLFELGLDSLDHASLLLWVEETYNCKFGDEEVDGLRSVDAIVAALRLKSAS
jgi:acyl carrier protein